MVLLLKFCYNFVPEKHVLDIVLPNIPNFDESGLVIGENVISVSPMLLVSQPCLR